LFTTRSHFRFKHADGRRTVVPVHGNEDIGMRKAILQDCDSGKKQWCSIEVDLTDYNGQRIKYWFNVEDIADTIKQSQIRQNLNVDTTFPVLNNPGSFWEQGEIGTRDNRYIYFSFDVTEENLDEISYSYIDSRGKEKEKVICRRLKDNICKSKKSFSRGDWSIDIQITDKAGNAIGFPVEFEVDY